MVLSKNDLRKNILARRRYLEENQSFERLNAQVCEHLVQFLKSRHGIFGAFHGLKSEPHIDRVLSELDGQIRFAFPRVNGHDLEYYLPQGEFQKSDLKIMEPHPDTSERVGQSEIRGVLVPGLMFDRDGYRLGRGRGFYDRFLARFQGEKIGVGFSYQIDEALPTEAHDQKLDYLVSDQAVLDFSTVRSVGRPTGPKRILRRPVGGADKDWKRN